PFTVTDNKIALVIACSSSPLAPSATAVCTATYAITQSDLDAGSVTNQATATNGAVTSNQAQATVSAAQTKTISLIKAVDKATAQMGGVLTYTLTYRNTGNITLHQVVIGDAVPVNTAFTSASNGGTLSGGSAAWTIDTLAPGATGNVTMTVTV